MGCGGIFDKENLPTDRTSGDFLLRLRHDSPPHPSGVETPGSRVPRHADKVQKELAAAAHRGRFSKVNFIASISRFIASQVAIIDSRLSKRLFVGGIACHASPWGIMARDCGGAAGSGP